MLKRLVRWFFYLLGLGILGGILWGLPYLVSRNDPIGTPWWSVGFIIIGAIILVIGIAMLIEWAFKNEKTGELP